MKKLSQLKDDDMLLVGESTVISKEDYLKEAEEYVGETVYTTTQYQANIDARDMIENALERESDNMYEDWYESAIGDIAESDINELQAILDRMLSGSGNIAYYPNEQVEID